VVEPVAPARRGDSRLRLLDGLRFVAALSVVLFHFTGRDSVAWAESVRDVFPFVSQFTIYGGFGPYLFFMISGFVVLMSAWGRRVPAFIASRVGRLYPAYWVAVLVAAVVLVLNQHIIDRWDSLGFPGVALNLTMFQSAFGVGHVDGVFWTLWVELKFYLLLVVMICIGITRARLLALCLVWPVAAALAARTDAVLLAQLLEPHYAPFFCIGILLYLVYREGWSGPTALLLVLNTCFALWVCAAHYIPWSVAVAGAPVSMRGLAVLLFLCIGAVAAATLTPLRRVDWRWLTLLGALTYPLYLVHQVPGWVLLHRLGPVLPAYAAVALVTVLVLVAAYLVHRFVETPFGPRLRRIVERDLERALDQDRAARPRHQAALPVPADRRPRPPLHAPGPRPAPRDEADTDVFDGASLVSGGR
jgi:peptidoglycan/LPS O-acetylase OafA/YrhL